MNQKISVIVPVYNGFPYIEKAIESVFAQAYLPHQVIVIDDGSTDKTQQVIAKYGNRIVTKRIERSGASVARNAGIQIATGDYLAFLDSDDVWFKNRLAVVAKYIQKFPDVGVLVSNYATRYKYHKGRMFKHYSTLKPKTRRLMRFHEPLRVPPFEILLDGNFVGTCSALVVKKEVLDRTGLFKEGLSYVEDLEILFRLAAQTNFLLSDQVTLYKRMHPANVSADVINTYFFHKKILIEMLVTYDDCRKYIEVHRLRGKVQKAIARLHYDLGNVYYNAGRRKETLKLYFEGLCCSPAPSNVGQFLWNFSKKAVRFCYSLTRAIIP